MSMAMEGTLEVLGGTIIVLIVAVSSLKLWKKRRSADKASVPSPSPVVFHPPSPERRGAEKGNLPPDSVEKSDGIKAEAKEEEQLAQKKNIGEEEAKAKKKEEEEIPKQKGKEEIEIEEEEEEIEEEEETPKPKEAAPRSEEKGKEEADEAQRPSPSLKHRAVAVGDKSSEIETPIGILEKPPVPDSLKKSGSFLSKIGSFGRQPAEQGDRKEKQNGAAVDTDAENFIEKFKKQLRLQRMESIMRYKETVNKDK